MKLLGWMALGAAMVVAPGYAAAQDTDWDTTDDTAEVDVGEVDVDVETDESEVVEHHESAWEQDRGLELQASGGLMSYTGEAAAQTTPGGAYGVLVGLEPFPLAGLELSYQGAAYQTDERLSGPQENIIENGAQGLIEVGPTIGMFEPYAFGGYQITRLNVYEREGATNPISDDTLSKIPAGAGVDLNLGDLLVGARGQYNFMIDQDAFDLDNSSTNQFAATANLGGQF